MVFSHNNQTDLYRQENTNNSKKKNEMKEMKKKKINFDESDRNIAPINYLDSHGVPFGAQMNMNEVQNDLYRNGRTENNENVEKNNENVEKNKKGKKLKKRRIGPTNSLNQPKRSQMGGVINANSREINCSLVSISGRATKKTNAVENIVPNASTRSMTRKWKN